MVHSPNCSDLNGVWGRQMSDEKLDLDHQLAERLLAIDDVDAIYSASGVH